MSMYIMKKNKGILLFFLLFAAAGSARAEKADREQPILIDADRIQIDDAKKINTFEGNVVMTQGTLVIHADRVVVTQDAKGNKHATAYSAAHPVTFRQKEDGVNEYVEGQGDRAVYDSGADTLELFEHAWVKRGQDLVTGNYIYYDSQTQFFKSRGGEKTPTGRVHAVIHPKPKDKKAANPPDALAPSESLGQEAK